MIRSVRSVLKLTGVAIGALCVLSALIVLLFLFAPLTGGIGALLVLAGVLCLLVYVALSAAMLTWAGVTRAGHALAYVRRGWPARAPVPAASGIEPISVGNAPAATHKS